MGRIRISSCCAKGEFVWEIGADTMSDCWVGVWVDFMLQEEKNMQFTPTKPVLVYATNRKQMDRREKERERKMSKLYGYAQSGM